MPPTLSATTSSSSSSSSSLSLSVNATASLSSVLMRPSTISSIRTSSLAILSAITRISLMVPGQAEIACTMSFKPSSIRFAISISPLRVRSSTPPISRMYIRTGSVVRPKSESTVASAAAATDSASSSLTAVATLSVNSIIAASGARSYTAIPISLSVLMTSWMVS